MKHSEMPISVYQAPYKTINLFKKYNGGFIQFTDKELEWMLANGVVYIHSWFTLYEIRHSVNAGYSLYPLCNLSVHTNRGRYFAYTAKEVNQSLQDWGAPMLNEN